MSQPDAAVYGARPPTNLPPPLEESDDDDGPIDDGKTGPLDAVVQNPRAPEFARAPDKQREPLHIDPKLAPRKAGRPPNRSFTAAATSSNRQKSLLDQPESDDSGDDQPVPTGAIASPAMQQEAKGKERVRPAAQQQQQTQRAERNEYADGEIIAVWVSGILLGGIVGWCAMRYFFPGGAAASAAAGASAAKIAVKATKGG